MPTVARRRDRVRDDDEDTTVDASDRPSRRHREDDDDEPRTSRRERAARDDDDDDAPEDRPRRSRREEPDDDDEPAPRSRRDRNDDDEEPRPKAKRDVPEGVRKGWDGADETAKSGGEGGGVAWLRIEDRVELVKFLEDAPLTSYRQHWLESASTEGKARPYLCPGAKCPICAQGDSPAGYYLFNVLYLSGGAVPEVRVLQVNNTAYKNLKEVFADRKTGSPIIDADGVFASVKKSGKGFQTRTTFTKVKERDLQDDWDEVFEYFDFKDLPDMLDDAMKDLYTPEEVSPKATPRRELEKLAKYLDEPDED